MINKINKFSKDKQIIKNKKRANKFKLLKKNKLFSSKSKNKKIVNQKL